MDDPNPEFLQLCKRAEEAPDPESFAQVLREMTAYFTKEWDRKDPQRDRTVSDPAA